jgi:hypothetical protein
MKSYLTNLQTKSFMQVLFRTTYCLQSCSQLEKHDEDKEIIRTASQRLETAIMHILLAMNGDLAVEFACNTTLNQGTYLGYFNLTIFLSTEIEEYHLNRRI